MAANRDRKGEGRQPCSSVLSGLSPRFPEGVRRQAPLIRLPGARIHADGAPVKIEQGLLLVTIRIFHLSQPDQLTHDLHVEPAALPSA